MFNFWDQLKAEFCKLVSPVYDADNVYIEFANVKLPFYVARSLLEDHKAEEQHVSELLEYIDELKHYNRLLRKENKELMENMP